MATTMTVKVRKDGEGLTPGLTPQVTGRQWYWVYEVESPTDDGHLVA